MKMDLNLQYFDDPTYSVTCYKDGHMTTFSASPNSSVAEDATVTLTVTPAAGYELDEIEVIAGGVTIEHESDAYTFKIGEANVVLNARSKANNKYQVVENRDVWINGSLTSLKRNMTLEKGKTGAIVGVTVNGTAITLSSEIVAGLVNEGVLIKI